MAVARLDAAAQGNVDDQSYTVSAGSDRCLVVGVQAEGAITPDSVTVTWGGQSMVRAVYSHVEAAGNDNEVALFYLLEAGIAAASGSTIAITGQVANFTWHAASYTGVHQGGGSSTVPETNTDGTTGATPNPLTGSDIVVGVDAAVVGLGGCGNATTALWGSDLTEQTDIQDITSPTTTGSMADGLFASGQTVNVEPTWASQNRASLCAMELAPASVATIEQEGYRWYSDGTESGSAARQAQDTVDTVAKAITVQLRALLNATGDPATAQFQLEYKETGDGDVEYRKVPTA